MSGKPRTVLKSLLVLGAVVLVASAVAVSWMKFAPRRVPDGQAALSTLTPDSLSDFRNAFNAGEGQVRILAMLSPT